MKNVILIPGLGYNQRIFEKLLLPGRELTYVNWIEPHPRESIDSYASRLFEPYLPFSPETVLIGHSFGGIMAQEIAAQEKVGQVVIISSIKSRSELPRSFKILAPSRL